MLRHIRTLFFRMIGMPDMKTLQKNGMRVGRNFFVQHQCMLDISHCWLISIGNDVTFAPRVQVLAHDASTKLALGYTRIGLVSIGDRVFIGSGTIVLPNVRIGNDCVIGAGSIVTRDVPDGTVWAGNPARQLCTLEDYLQRRQAQMEGTPKFDLSYTAYGKITDEKKAEMIRALAKGPGYVE